MEWNVLDLREEAAAEVVRQAVVAVTVVAHSTARLLPCRCTVRKGPGVTRKITRCVRVVVNFRYP